MNKYIAIKPPNIRGKFKTLLLYYLSKEPLHGYALIKAITRDFGLRYVPSPGVIYPALQELESEGYIVKEARGRRIVYRITEKGRRLLDENMDSLRFVFEHIKVYRTFTEELKLDELLNSLVVLGVWYDRLSPQDQRVLKDEVASFHKTIKSMIEKARPSESTS